MLYGVHVCKALARGVDRWCKYVSANARPHSHATQQGQTALSKSKNMDAVKGHPIKYPDVSVNVAVDANVDRLVVMGRDRLMGSGRISGMNRDRGKVGLIGSPIKETPVLDDVLGQIASSSSSRPSSLFSTRWSWSRPWSWLWSSTDAHCSTLHHCTSTLSSTLHHHCLSILRTDLEETTYTIKHYSDLALNLILLCHYAHVYYLLGE